MRILAIALLCCLAVPAQEGPALRLTRIASGIPNPTDIQSARDGTGRLFLVQQNGIIRVWRDGALLAEPFLDIRTRTRAGGERGLLGLAFPPGFAQKRSFYVNYTDLQGTTIIARYRLTANDNRADFASEQVLMRVPQPFANHNGGQLQFGPDGFLYIGLGDGGSANDPQNRSQNPGELLGKMLRVDVESDPTRVVVPSTNPFVNDSNYRPEIWATGLRNPWRYAFDRLTGDLWIADVGQNRAEEVSFQPASSRGGENYGWKIMEGFQCLVPGCTPPPGLTPPVVEYGRSLGCSVTGGYVYRGSAIAGLSGFYLYGDFCSGRLWGVRRDGDRIENRLLMMTGMPISTFGEDEAGEIYLSHFDRGEIYLIGAMRTPLLTERSVVNAASFQPGLVPGSIASIFLTGAVDAPGVTSATTLPLPSSLGTVSVTINGNPAPLYAIANAGGQEQINLQVPFELAGANAASVVVRSGSASSAAVSVPVLASQPGVFTRDGSAAIVVRQGDNSLVSSANPLRAGELAYFYATGLGAVDNAPATGAPAPRDPLARARAPLSVTMGGQPCEILFAGLAPDLAGVFQINVRVPNGLSAGEADLIVSAGGTASPAVRVPVR